MAIGVLFRGWEPRLPGQQVLQQCAQSGGCNRLVQYLDTARVNVLKTFYRRIPGNDDGRDIDTIVRTDPRNNVYPSDTIRQAIVGDNDRRRAFAQHQKQLLHPCGGNDTASPLCQKRTHAVQYGRVIIDYADQAALKPHVQ